MKKSAQTMFLIGKIINIIEVVLLAILAAILAFILAGQIVHGTGAVFGIACLIAIFFIALFVCIPVIFLLVCSKQNKKIVEGNNETKPRVIILVLGILTDNLFYILAGIFGLVARNQELNGQVSEPQENNN